MSLLDRVVALTLPFVPRPIVRQVANRYIAGETTDDALRVASDLNQQGFRTTMDILGEDVHDLDQARAASAHYLELFEEIHRKNVDSNVSIKLTQFGLKLDQDVCLTLVDTLVRRAHELGNFVRIDMEDSSCTSDTLEIYRRLRANHTNVGVVVQAYLRRTIDDVEKLSPLCPNYRLCKGVYVEPREIAFRNMEIINRNYTFILE